MQAPALRYVPLSDDSSPIFAPSLSAIASQHFIENNDRTDANRRCQLDSPALPAVGIATPAPQNQATSRTPVAAVRVDAQPLLPVPHDQARRSIAVIPSFPLSPSSSERVGPIGASYRCTQAGPAQRSRRRGRSISPAAPTPTAAIGTVVGSLAIVLGLFVVLAWFSRRFAPAGSAALPKEAVELLGRRR